MLKRSWVLAVVAMGCTSGASQPPRPPVLSNASTETLAFGVCPLPDVTRATALEPPPSEHRAPGLLGTEGLEPREEPQAGKTCQAARITLDATNTKILDAPKSAAATGVSRAWDRKTEPARWARIAQRYGLDQRHRAQLGRDGFVVAKGATHWNFVEAYHEIFQSQLPIYVSIDSVLHAIYASHSGVLEDVETKVLLPKLRELLSTMHCEMATAAASWPRDVAHDVDLYLTVARMLLAMERYPGTEKPKPVSLLGSDAEAQRIVDQIVAAKGFDELELFGRRRVVDFGAFRPRGHYSNSAPYFRTMSWLSRIELNLVSRSSRSSTMQPDPSETPREVAVALALVDLAQGTKQLVAISEIDAVWGELAGKRADISFAELAVLRDKAGVTPALSAQPALARVIGGGYRRAIPTQPHPDGLTDLPVIASMFGPRVGADTAAIAPIIQPAVPQRFAVAAADIAYLLGHDRAKHHLAKELATYPELGKQLGVARKALDARLTGDDMYSMWLKAIRSLAAPTAGTTPSFMKSDGFADLRMSSAIAAYGQLRTNYELMAGMAYLGSGCEIPDGYVEPAAATYDALIAYAERGKVLLAKIDPKDVSEAQGYYTRLATTLRVLRAIVTTELAGRPLTTAQKEWLSMVVEIVINDGSGAPPSYAGWYFDLFRNFNDATHEPDFLTGYAQNELDTMYLGASDPRIGVFVVDTGGPPRVVVGPIAHAWETSAPTSKGRLEIDETDPTTRPAMHEPWAASYTVEATKPPKLVIREAWRDGANGFEIVAATAVGPVTLKLLDHHRVPFASQTRTIGAGRTKLWFPEAQFQKAEVVQLVHGTYHQFAQRQTGGEGSFSFSVATQTESDEIEEAFPETP